LHFASDNAGPVHPRVMSALLSANDDHAMPYGACPWTARAVALLRETLGAPGAEVALVPTGTAANALALAALVDPWQRVFCSDIAHIHRDEVGATPFYAGGAELALVPQTDGRMAPADLAAGIAALDPERRGAVSLTQVTEAGTVYPLAALADLCATAAAAGLPVHMDGARFANAVAATGCTAAAMARGLTALSFGGTKNGLMGVEAVVVFEPDRAHGLAPRRQRGGHLFSKHRYLAAQMVGYLEDGLWLETAAAANARAQRLAAGLARHPDVTIAHPVEANMIFARWPAALHARLRAKGAVYYMMDSAEGAPADRPLLARLVCDWSIPEEEIDRFLGVLAAG
jgi:threonine aldolase